MRIHTDTLTTTDVYEAARIARVGIERFNDCGSRSRDKAYDVTLTGESRRRPNGGNYGAGDDYAATWDQWGVFLSVLFDRDATLTIPRVYTDRDAFDAATAYRFEPTDVRGPVSYTTYWPADAHGDHTFRFNGTPYQQECTRCSAVQSWEHRLAS